MPQQAALKSKSVVDLSIQVPSLKFTTIDLNSLIQMINREEVCTFFCTMLEKLLDMLFD